MPEPSAESLPGLVAAEFVNFRADEKHTNQENEVRETVNKGASHQPHCRLIQVDGQESQEKNGGPAYYVTDQDQGKAQGDPEI